MWEPCILYILYVCVCVLSLQVVWCAGDVPSQHQDQTPAHTNLLNPHLQTPQRWPLSLTGEKLTLHCYTFKYLVVRTCTHDVSVIWRCVIHQVSLGYWARPETRVDLPVPCQKSARNISVSKWACRLGFCSWQPDLWIFSIRELVAAQPIFRTFCCLYGRIVKWRVPSQRKKWTLHMVIK